MTNAIAEARILGETTEAFDAVLGYFVDFIASDGRVTETVTVFGTLQDAMEIAERKTDNVVHLIR